MSTIELEACGKGLEAEKLKKPKKPKRSQKPRTNPGKQYTGQELLKELRSFASDFRDFNRNPIKISTPQADLGIGPVKYNVELSMQEETSREKLNKLNELIKLEKRNGDRLIRFDAALLFLATGREDPWPALPALLRMVTRAEIQENTARSLDQSEIALMKREVPTLMVPLVLYFDQQKRIANGSEVAFLADLAEHFFEWICGEDVPDQFEFSNIIKILAKRRKNKHHATMARTKMQSIFKDSCTQWQEKSALKIALVKYMLRSEDLNSLKDAFKNKSIQEDTPEGTYVLGEKNMEGEKAIQSFENAYSSMYFPSEGDTSEEDTEEEEEEEDMHAANEENQIEPTDQKEEEDAAKEANQIEPTHPEEEEDNDWWLESDGEVSDSTDEAASSD